MPRARGHIAPIMDIALHQRYNPSSIESRIIQMSYIVAVIGATGNVGREMLNILSEREFPAREVFAIASRRSQGLPHSLRHLSPPGWKRRRSV